MKRLFIMCLAATFLLGSEPLVFSGSYPNGSFRNYSSDDTTHVITKGTFKNGKLHGEILTFSGENFDTLSQITYNEGVIHGPVKLWYTPLSVKRAFAPYTNDKRPAEYKKNQNLLKMTATYDNGIPTGVKNHFYPTGQKRSEYIYREQRIKKAELYTKSGAPAAMSHMEKYGQCSRDFSADKAYYLRIEQAIYGTLPDSLPYFTPEPHTTIESGSGWSTITLGAHISDVESIVGKGHGAESLSSRLFASYYSSPDLYVVYDVKSEKVLELFFMNKGGPTPFRGTTDKGISLTSSRADVMQAYGDPAKLSNVDKKTKKNLYVYDGISFRFEKEQIVLISIERRQRSANLNAM